MTAIAATMKGAGCRHLLVTLATIAHILPSTSSGIGSEQVARNSLFKDAAASSCYFISYLLCSYR